MTVSPSPEQLLAQELCELRDLIKDGDFYNDYDGSVARIATFDKAIDALESTQSEIARLTTVSGDMVEEMARALEESDTRDEANRLPWQDYEHMAQAAATIAKGRIERLTTALSWFDKHGEHLANDVSSGHSARGSAASEWMREDDADFRSDLCEALANARAALKDSQP